MKPRQARLLKAIASGKSAPRSPSEQERTASAGALNDGRDAPARKPDAPRSPHASREVRLGKGEGGIRVASAEFAAGAANAGQMPDHAMFEAAPEIAFCGRSNVGKSSLLNALLSRRGLARTSGTPGCTRQVNFFDVRLASATAPAKRMVFVDLPGYGYAKVSKAEAIAWKALLEGYLHERATLRAAVVLVDARRGIESEELDLIEFLQARPGLRVVLAATKLDKIPRTQHKSVLKTLLAPVPKGVIFVATSAETGSGRDELWQTLLSATTEGSS